MSFNHRPVYNKFALMDKMRKIIFIIMIVFIPTIAHARGGTNGQMTAMLYGALGLGFACLSIFMWFRGMIIYSKLIARIFGVSENVADADWWHYACFYATAIIFFFIYIASK